MLTAPISYAELRAYCAEQRNSSKFWSDVKWFINSYGESYDLALPSTQKQAETEAMDVCVQEFLEAKGILPKYELTLITKGQTSPVALRARGYS